MLTSMGVASPKFSKSDRKPKKTKHCTIPNLRKIEAKEFKKKGTGLNKVHMEIKKKEINHAKIEENQQVQRNRKGES